VTTRVLYFDCFAGAAGDMILGALLDAGVPVEELRGALGSLGVGHELKVSRVVRAGIDATHVEVVERPGTGRHEHRHDGGRDRGHTHAHDHRSLDDITHLIEQSNLSAKGKARAVRLFRRLGEAEAAIHGVPLEQIHLHEVGAVDSIIDIVGAVWALEWLGVDDVVASPLNVGSGTVTMAHGTFPVPAPATLRLLTGAPVYSSGLVAELLTPTGALVITDYARSYGPMPAMTVDRVGYGAGTRELDPVPNVLRVVIGERPATAASPDNGGDVVKVECEVDDMNPQWFAPLSDRLFAAGALDVFLTPVQMKKGRPGTLVTVLAPPALRSQVAGLLFAETTTIGLRWDVMHREGLERRHEAVAVPGGEVRVKVARRHGRVLTATPEFDDCLRIADATGRPVRDVHADALEAWRAGRRSDQSE
jgi:uncharacterized protein (TIGR00299 family) protein